MALTERRPTARSVPWAMQQPDRVPKQRYYDPEFFALEVEQLWPRVWQMACRLEEIPDAGDRVVYDILDQSVIVVRTDDLQVRAFHNACRHRGVKLVEGTGTCPGGFTCSFHGWCYGLDGANTFVYEPDVFAEENLRPDDIALTPVRCELWGGCAWINLDDDAPPLRGCLEPFATVHDAWKVESLRTEWWLSCRLPVNWKLAAEAFMEGYHVMETHPQLTRRGAAPRYTPGIPGRGFGRTGTERITDPRQLVDATIKRMRVLSDGMAGMLHGNDVGIAEELPDLELPDDPAAAVAAWSTAFADAVMHHYQDAGCDIPDFHEITRLGYDLPMMFCWPHYFLLPSYSSAASYRIRPLGPEETLFELWSLTRYPPGQEPGRPTPPEPMAPDDSRWPPIPAQDFSNLPKQQLGLHARGFEYMRLSNKVEGLISKFQQLVDGYLAGLPHERLVPAVQRVNDTIDVPITELDL